MGDPTQVRFAAVIVAAGAGLRAGQRVPKQFARWRGKPLVRHSAETLVAAGAKLVCVVIPIGSEELAEQLLGDLENVVLTIGGKTRQDSAMHGLLKLTGPDIDCVLIHDAARPVLPLDVISRLLSALDDHAGAIPVLPVVDSLALANGTLMAGSADREVLRRVQTPQAFRFEEILAAHEAWHGETNAGDDAQVARAAGLTVALVEGDERLRKLTFAEDFMDNLCSPRIGTGFDVHRLTEGEELWLCGVRIEHERGLSGHSDADVALHAVVDAILGAMGAGDIGQHFPPSDPQWRAAPSSRFVEHAVALARESGFGIGNVDVTIICEAPKIGPHREAMRARLAELLHVGIESVNVKATTTERLGFTGRGEGIAAQAVAALVPLERM
jgi:2-C-methyl-D-erythritol 4-phosphate cytidylyltransferase/2-C-methyl-D-erythritol 2,4-cyclodiphosphate synthase